MSDFLSSNRRNFIRGVAVTGGALALGSVLPESAEALPPLVDPDIAGVIESHVHADPDVRARCIDQVTLTHQCRLNGYRGIMYKCHDFATADNAYILRQTVPGIEVFGGIVLNKNNGDKVNVHAAKMATQITGGLCRCIWMPTYQSSFDMKKKNAAGVPVVDDSGKVLPEVIQVMELCGKEDIIFATGHSSPEESVILIKKAKEVGLKKAVVTHCTQEPWFLSLDQAKEVLDNGGYLEHSVLPFFKGPNAPLAHYRSARQTTMKDYMGYITLDPKRQFINTDLGQAGNIHPIDGMRAFVRGLRKEGLSGADITLVSRKVPAYLLGLEKNV
jgi:hypothetical protein